MGIAERDIKNIEPGYQLPPLTKHITQERMNAFEASGITGLSNIHTDPEVARAAGIGSSPIASGRMTTAYVSEVMTAAFGERWAHGGTSDLTFLRPVRDGDTLTLHAMAKEKVSEGEGVRLVFEVWAENQNGDKTAVGTASVLI
ncbi:MAG: MaoC family dehydratase [Bacteroidetes bacterium]|nr:MaoC family dehydratase [Bacteroidota bacterium]MCL5025471.1 MaoC family dehydratase [Chloroflexota bacterium]